MTARLYAAPLAVLAFLATPTLYAQSAAPPRAAVVSTLDSLARDAVDAGRFSSVSIAVVRGRDTLLFNAYGLADRDANTAATPATEYRLASVTKQFTAAMVLQLAGEGKLSLTDTVGRWFPGAPVAWRSVSVAQLLDHTSGIPSYTSLGPSWARRWGEDLSPDTLIALTYERPMNFQPGTRWSYNNTGYVLLGRIVELVTGSTYETAVRERLARPHGLRGLGYCPSTPTAATQARPYNRGPQLNFVPAPHLSMTHPYAAGALCATAGDMVQWNRALHEGRVVPTALYTRMVTPQGAAVSEQYGFGVGRDTVAGRQAIAHNGGIHGGSTENWYFPSDSTSVVLLANTSNGAEVGRLVRQLARATFGAPLVQRAKAIPLAAADRARYAGRYELNLGERTLVIDVRIEGELLVAQPAGQPTMRLVHVAPRTFVAEDNNDIRFEFTGDGERASGLVSFQAGRRAEGQRLN